MNADSANFYRSMLNHISDGVYFVDRNRNILFWNDGASRLTGYQSDEVVGRCCHDNILQHVDDSGRELCRNGCPLAACIGDGREREALVHLRRKDGQRIPVFVRVQPVRDDSGAVVGAIETFRDDSAHAQARLKAEEMQRLAYLDSVTQLPNRRFVEMALDAAVERYAHDAKPFGALLLDLDGLKRINDTYGHSGGDRALRCTGQALVASLRPTDVVGRWGGDEFVAVVQEVRQTDLHTLALRCSDQVAATTVDDGRGGKFGVRISAGAALVQSGDTVLTLLNRADELMYRAKHRSGVAAD